MHVSFQIYCLLSRFVVSNWFMTTANTIWGDWTDPPRGFRCILPSLFTESESSKIGKNWWGLESTGISLLILFTLKLLYLFILSTCVFLVEISPYKKMWDYLLSGEDWLWNLFPMRNPRCALKSQGMFCIYSFTILSNSSLVFPKSIKFLHH